MRNLLISASAALALLANPASALPERAGDFALLDTQGEFHQLSRYRHQEAMVLMAYDTACANQDAALEQFKQTAAQFAEQGVSFALIESGTETDIEALRAARASTGLDLPMLIDDGQLVSETLQLSTSGEVIVLDPQRLNVLYRGPLSAQTNAVIAAELAGGVDETTIVAASGCAIDYPVSEAQLVDVPDYGTEVAPIIVEQCASCHREGGIGPFAMDSHLMLQGWSPMIREVLLTKRMPPTQVDPYVGHFDNALYISPEEMQTLVHWIDGGAPRGTSPVDPLTEVEHVDMKAWRMGEPDYIVKAPAHEIPATGVLDYINVNVPLEFDEDKWVRAVQYIPGDEAVLHHLLTYVTPPTGTFEGGEADTSGAARRFLEGYAPGKVDPIVFPENTGVKIPAGYQLSMQFHYTTNGRATMDETKLGLYIYDEPPAHENFTRSVAGMFRIPPYARDHEVEATYTFNEDVVVTGLRAHMHFRGKDMQFFAEYPNGTTEQLLNVPNYSYAWQPTYQLSDPVTLPSGTKVHVTGSFDNSEHNPANPDPSKELTFGLQSWDEMFIGYWTYHAQDGGE